MQSGRSELFNEPVTACASNWGVDVDQPNMPDRQLNLINISLILVEHLSEIGDKFVSANGTTFAPSPICFFGGGCAAAAKKSGYQQPNAVETDQA